MSVKKIDCATLKQWMESGEAVLVDVREPGEFAEQSIPGAVLLPMGDLCSQKLPEFAGKKLVIHCRKGGRGGRACTQLREENLPCEVYNLEGGIEAWAAAGYPIKAAS